MSTRITPELLRAYRSYLTHETGILHRSKGTSHLMRFAAKRLVRSFGMRPRTFMERFSTVVWVPFVRRPVAFYNWKLGSTASTPSLRERLAVFGHEATHAYQMRRDGPREWTAAYTMDRASRTDYEIEAYTFTIVICLLTTGTHLRGTLIAEPPEGFATVAEYADAPAHSCADSILENYAIGYSDGARARKELLRAAKIMVATRRPLALSALSALRTVERSL